MHCFLSKIRFAKYLKKRKLLKTQNYLSKNPFKNQIYMKKFTKFIIPFLPKIFVTSLFFCLTFFFTNTAFSAPSSTNSISMYIPAVRFGGSTGLSENTAKIGENNYQYLARPLNLDDQIRYGYSSKTLININHVNNPSPTASYLKAYINDDSSEENFIANIGNSPISISSLQSKLQAGKNTVLFVWIDSPNGPTNPATKVQFTFDYAGPVTKPNVSSSANIKTPTIEAINPGEKAVISRDSEKEFNLKLNNFLLSKNPENKPNEGVLEIYFNEIKPQNLIQTIDNGAANEAGGTDVKINTANNENWSKIPDSQNTKIIFLLKNSPTSQVGETKILNYITNYGGTVDIGLPKITMLEPSFNANVKLDHIFKVKVDNFKLLNKVDTDTRETKSNEGYIQIRVNDKLYVPNTDKTEFTLREIKATDIFGRINVRVDLVNTQFERLKPAAFVENNVNLEKEKNDQEAVKTNNNNSKFNNWRTIIIILTVALIWGSIAVLIARS